EPGLLWGHNPGNSVSESAPSLLRFDLRCARYFDASCLATFSNPRVGKGWTYCRLRLHWQADQNRMELPALARGDVHAQAAIQSEPSDGKSNSARLSSGGRQRGTGAECRSSELRWLGVNPRPGADSAHAGRRAEPARHD